MIQTQNLVKRYGREVAVNQLNLTVRQGTVFGIVGENGAGKTTTLSMLATLTVPTSGQAFIAGYEVTHQPHEVRRAIGYMPDSFGVYDELTVMEYLRFYADCYGVDRRTAERRAKELLDWVDLGAKRHSYVNALSRGMQQRLEIARCLMHNPEVLILDEPSSGLDPRSRLEMRAVLQRLRSLGKTILVSSHILHELGSVADEIGIMRGGELSAIASVNVMLAHSDAFRTLWISGEGPREAWEAAFADDPHVLNVVDKSPAVEVLYAGTVEQQAQLMKSLMDRGVVLYQFAERPTDIEELFLRLTDQGGEAD
ncbi:ABC transporter ATP-binding protein [Alicyclobacillus shizuokensis]|uniref:ABC transporter ATP-binding protein n=1 Tax=Alicyclobacillus shizuokensis TaxID=392014 RepID=UPI00082D41F7|nr:ABC transporter ATP-binding protein [Alicyclobacillus shizuokensis]MCL6626364.1 ABC transporter ATP-binding protein [Alicyclobacillus shizuokensis]